MKDMIKLTLRTIKGSVGRFIAIFAIIALGVGFFSGIRITKDAMIKTADKYLREHKLFDVRLISTYGFTSDEIKEISEMRGVSAVEGSYSMDIIYNSDDDSESVLKLHSITNSLNTLDLVDGRFPENEKECVVDSRKFSSDYLGRKIKLNGSNPESNFSALSSDEYKIVGIVKSPLYINFQRGSTNLGNGKVGGFMYVLPEAFTSELYTEMYVTLKNDFYLYDETYIEFVEDFEYDTKPVCKEFLEERFINLKTEGQQKIDQGLIEYEEGEKEYKKSEILGKGQIALLWAELELKKKACDANLETVKGLEELINKRLEYNLIFDNYYKNLKVTLEEERKNLEVKLNEYNTENAEYQKKKKEIDDQLEEGRKALEDAKAKLDKAQADLDALSEPELYILTRSTNIGYVSFDNDTNIIYGISKVFPVFFILVAALVCNTTMSRMVTEERGKIGTLKAIGYSTGEIITIYLLYSGSSAILGCLCGFFLGSYVLPNVIWVLYGLMYGFAPLEFLVSVPLLVISLIVSVICSVGVTLISCKKALRQTPASLMRPDEMTGGKKVFAEKIPILKNCLGFFGKISIRNTFKYKSRLIMMILGIAGCTALLITGFGIDDSISGIVDDQYNKIMCYDYILTLKDAINDRNAKEFEENSSFEIGSMLFLYEDTLTYEKDGKSKEITLNVPQTDEIDNFIFLKDGERAIKFPQKGECVISRSVAGKFDIKKGDKISLTNSAMKRFTFTVSDICDNHVGNYIFVSNATFSAQNGGECLYNRICVNVKEGKDVHSVAVDSAKNENVASLGINFDTRKSLDEMLGVLNLVIYVVSICAGALAFIVIYNLTNLNITERIREIATLKVIGFKMSESALYVFRETALQSVGGIIFGIPLGIMLHSFVMSQIAIDFLSFDCIIHPKSYLISIALTLLFLILVDILLYGKIKKINPAEALKSVE